MNSSVNEDGAEQSNSCVEQQLCEMEMLSSIYSKDEITFDSDCSPYVMSYCDRCNEDSGDTVSSIVKQLDNEEMRLGFTLKLLINSHAVEVKCDLPKSYPLSAPPLIFVRTSSLISRQNQSLFRRRLDEFIGGLDLGEALLFTILDWINESLSSYIDSKPEATDSSSLLASPCSFTRMWIYSHHIYSKFKRRDIIAWANELSLHGFSMCGKPGLVCVEGYTEDVEEYWSRLRRLNWKRLVMKEREDVKCDTPEQLTELYRFEEFEEKAFAGRASSVSFHPDLGHLRTFLQERSCSHMFEIYFGVDGRSLEVLEET